MFQCSVVFLWLLGYLAKSKADLSKNPGKAQVNRPTLLRSLFTLGLLCKQFDFDSDVKPKNEVSSLVLPLLKPLSTIWLQCNHKSFIGKPFVAQPLHIFSSAVQGYPINFLYVYRYMPIWRWSLIMIYWLSSLSRVPLRTQCLLYTSTSLSTLMKKSVKKPLQD